MPSASYQHKGNVFVSYRRRDAAGETGRLVDVLKTAFYDNQIFLDIETLMPGLDFTKALAQSLESCDVLLAVIGPDWTGPADKDGVTRIQKPDDWIRREIEAALNRDIAVIPVLVGGANLPAPDELPESLHPLLNRHTVELSNSRWKYDTHQLINSLIKLGIKPKQAPQSGPPVRSANNKSNNFVKYLVVALAVIGALALVGVLLENNKEPDIEPKPIVIDSPKTEPIINSNNASPNSNGETEIVIPKPPTYANIAGEWRGYDVASGAEICVHIEQKENKLLISTHYANVPFSPQSILATGGGEVDGREVNYYLSGGGYTQNGRLEVSNNRKTLTGIAENGTSFTLDKK